MAVRAVPMSMYTTRQTVWFPLRTNEMRIFLGDDYVKIDSGKWRSLDGTRQFRVKPDDYLGNHGIGQPTVPNTPHIHFEFLTPRSNGNGFDVIKNIHVPIND